MSVLHVNHTLVYYNHAENGCYFNVHTPKTKAGTRQIPMLDYVKEAFLQEKQYQEENDILCKVTIDGYTDLLPRFSCHSLRHTFTTRLVESGVNIKVVQDVLGHKDVKTTLNIYTDATQELKQREFETLQKKINGQYYEAQRGC